MSRIISALTIALGLALPAAPALAANPDAGKPALAADAPDRHIVVPGDTLWGISGKFLKDPWRWPELWRMNKDEIRNPHRIYPGDIIVLDRSKGTLSVARTIKLEPKVYASGHQSEIPSIPPQVINPFLSQPLVIEADALDQAPRIVGTDEGRVLVGSDDHVFVRGIDGDSKRDWSVYRPGKPLKDPDSGALLGYEAVYLGTAKLVAAGELAKLRVTSSKQEIRSGDRLIETTRPPLVAFAPHRPEKTVGGRLIGIYSDGGTTGGQFNVVTLNRGRQDGLEIGNVLALSRSGRVQESVNPQGVKETVTYPDQRYGLLFVFRTFERVSYALVMEATQPLVLGDAIGNP